MAALLTFVFWIIVLLVLASLLVNGYMIALMMRYPSPQRASEVHTIKTEDGWFIRLFRRKSSEAPGEPVLLVHGLAANRLNFDAPAGLSIVDTLVEEGYDCWTVELRCCESATPAEGRDIGDISFDDYLFKDLPAAIAYIRQTTGYEKVHWVGHSMGGMLLYAYNAAFGSEFLASGVALGAPAGFKNVAYKPPAFLFRLTMVAPRLVRTILKSLTPFTKSLRPKYIGFPVNWDNVHPALEPSTLFNMVEAVPPQVAREVDGWLATGSWKVKGGRLDVTAKLAEIDVPLLVICGKDDPFTPEIKIQPFFDALPGKDKQLIFLSKKNGFSANYGHADLAFGMNSTQEVYMPALEWIQDHPVTTTRRKATHKAVKAPKPAVSDVEAKPSTPLRKARTSAKPKAAPKRKPAAEKTPAKSKAAPRKKATAKKQAAAKKKPAPKAKASTSRKTASKKKRP